MIKEKKFLLIQALRVYACLLVVFGHYFFLYFKDVLHVNNIYTSYLSEYIIQPLNFNIGNLGVIQFFFISGFVITMVGMRESRFEFIVKRFFRIFPPILFSLLVIALFYIIYHNIYHFTDMTKFIGANHSGGELTIGEFLRNLFLIDNDMTGVTWTLRIEALFYLLVFVFLPLLKTKPAQLYWGISSIIIGWYISKSIWGVIKQLYEHCYNGYLSYVVYLILGSLFYLYYDKRIKKLDFITLSIVFLVLLLRGHQRHYNHHGGYVLLSYGLLALSVYLDNRISVHRALVYLGNISYSVYLNHLTPCFLLMNMAVAYFGYSDNKMMLIFLAMAFVFLGISAFSYKYVEQPAQQLARKFIKDVSLKCSTIKFPLYVSATLSFCMFFLYPMVEYLILFC